ncbi:hypothetical protein BaRGS_00018840 [Batillaria attramentaria]|uniref:CARD domain-containing protein n=1 Tax=Batillaria attramentaria TaxID=370345 RepID=A0ABD0KRP7_9CAEN
MDKDQNQVLQRAWFKLVNEIADIHSVVHCLYAKEALTTNLRDNILQRDDTRQGRVANLLSILQRKSDGFEKLYDALVECDEPTAKLLIPGLRGTRSGAGPKDCVHGSPPQLDSVTLPSTWPDNTVHTADNVEVVRVSKDNQFMRAQFQAATDPHRSPDAQEFRGIFLLINNKDFSKAREEGRQMKDRLGTEKDMTALQKLFGGLWFKVQIKPDRTAAVNRLVSKATTVKGERQQPVFTPAAFNRKFYFFPGLTRPRVRS